MGLYRATVTRVTSVPYKEVIDGKVVASVKLQSVTQKLIVEKVDNVTFDRMPGGVVTLLNKGIIAESWAKKTESDMPLVLNDDTDVLVVNSIEPYVPKRAREE